MTPSRLRVFAVLLLSLTAADAVPEGVAPPHEWDRIAAMVGRDAPSQDLVDRLYDFMEKYPTDPRSDRLQLWTAITQQRRKFHNEAVKEFDFLVKDFPNSPLAVQALRLQIDSYAAIGKSDKSTEIYQKILAKKPKDLAAADAVVVSAFRDAVLHLAAVANQKNDLPGTIALLTQLPDKRESLSRIADLHIARNDVNAAVAVLAKLPDPIESLTRIVQVYINAERHEDALNAIRRLPPDQKTLGYKLTITAYASRPGAVQLYNLLEEVLTREKPGEASSGLIQQLVGAIKAKGPAEGDKVYNIVIQRYAPLKRWAEYAMCQAHKADLARLAKFIGDYHTGADVEQCKTFVGEAYESSGQPDKAREAYWRLDDKPAAHFHVAETYHGALAVKKDLAAGQREYSEIVKRFYSPAVCCQALLARAELEAGPIGKADTAITTLKELVDRFSREGQYPVQALLRAAALHRGQQQFDQAIALYEKIILQYPQSNVRHAWMLIGECHDLKRDQPRAIAVYRMVLKKYAHTAEASHAHTLLETKYNVPDTDVSDR